MAKAYSQDLRDFAPLERRPWWRAASREASPAPVQRFVSRAQLNPSLTLVASPSSQECLWDERQWLF
jgi:hypothetical protein